MVLKTLKDYVFCWFVWTVCNIVAQVIIAGLSKWRAARRRKYFNKHFRYHGPDDFDIT